MSEKTEPCVGIYNKDRAAQYRRACQPYEGEHCPGCATERIAELEFALAANRTSLQLSDAVCRDAIEKLLDSEKKLTSMWTLAGELEKLVKYYHALVHGSDETTCTEAHCIIKPALAKAADVLKGLK